MMSQKLPKRLGKDVRKVDLSSYNNSWYKPGAGKLKQVLWFLTSALFFQSSWNPFSGLKIFLLRLFGARIGKGMVIKPSVNIKYPWRLIAGDHCWIGEQVWIDNLAPVTLGDHVCLSQGAMLLTGNHDYKKASFDLMVKGVILEEGVWIGAQSVVCPGVRCYSHAVLAVQSVAQSDLEAYTIYQGNPAKPIRNRVIE
jgi:putative colanic acid biosynthesis acetyltransferase WcaF